MRYSLCIEPVFAQVDICERIAKAKECGADAVEFWSGEDKDLEKIAKICEREQMPVAAMSVRNSWDVRLNSDRNAVLRELSFTADMGEILGCRTFIGLAGDVNTHRDNQKALLIENLKAAAELMEKRSCLLVVEALNSRKDHKGYYLDSSYDAFEIVRCVNSPYVKVLYDCYHMQVMEGNITENIRQNLEWIGHFHCAGIPGRNEPQSGELYYPKIIESIRETAYQGYFGLEYWPTYHHETSVKDTLAWLKTGL
ncbi:MAG: TIM barrel protein [Lachnospiraceae bacterium]|nr:TIM barrel protein [Lachnospiraceae bacterium]